jgi:hypothetical protein
VPEPTWIDFQLHIGDVILSVLGAICLGFVKRIYNVLVGYPQRLANVEEVVDEHSSFLTRNVNRAVRFRKLSQKRRQDDPTEFIGGV